MRSADGRTRTVTPLSTRPSNVRVYQFHHIRDWGIKYTMKRQRSRIWGRTCNTCRRRGRSFGVVIWFWLCWLRCVRTRRSRVRAVFSWIIGYIPSRTFNRYSWKTYYLLYLVTALAAVCWIRIIMTQKDFINIITFLAFIFVNWHLAPPDNSH